VEPVCQQGVQEGGKKRGFDPVYRLRHRVWNVVGARGRGVRGFGEGPGYLFGGEGSVILIAREAEEQGRGGVWREKSGQEAFLLLRPDWRPLERPGTSAVGDQMRTSWLSTGSGEWPRTRSLTSVFSWPRQWP